MKPSLMLAFGLLSLFAVPLPSVAQEPAKAQEQETPKEQEQTKGKGRPGKQPRATSGISTNENKATPVERIRVAKDFKVELLYSVPGDSLGSWVNLCVDGQGRIIVSDQYGGLYRF
ncbi:MAG: hypothetical protein HY300_03860, partial [Verrucomicrobia bacterium]|nr:hypothetical protein [Verrucomicrobiota bacterium]